MIYNATVWFLSSFFSSCCARNHSPFHVYFSNNTSVLGLKGEEVMSVRLPDINKVNIILPGPSMHGGIVNNQT